MGIFKGLEGFVEHLNILIAENWMSLQWDEDHAVEGEQSCAPLISKFM